MREVLTRPWRMGGLRRWEKTRLTGDQCTQTSELQNSRHMLADVSRCKNMLEGGMWDIKLRSEKLELKSESENWQMVKGFKMKETEPEVEEVTGRLRASQRESTGTEH